MPDRLASDGNPGPRAKRRWFAGIIRRIVGWLALAAIIGLCASDFQPGDLEIAAAGHQLGVVGWELSNLPDKWVHRLLNAPRSWLGGSSPATSIEYAAEFFANGQRLRWIDRRLIYLSARDEHSATSQPEIAVLVNERTDRRRRQDELRPDVEETLESAVAGALRSQGIGTWAGLFPPVDTALVGSPTVLITSPRDRIERGEEMLLRTGLSTEQRIAIETQLEKRTDLSALVVNTGGIAFFPSITVPDAGMDFVLEIIAHEWVHQWLWFRPLGQRYFQGGDLLTLNETVATIAGQELGRLAGQHLQETPPGNPKVESSPSGTNSEPSVESTAPAQFDFQAEMRDTRIRVDALLAAGDVTGAEHYMEERRRTFVENGYPIRRLNQAYFAFHGSYATTGAAGVNVIGEQVEKLRRSSPSLAEFLRTAAQFRCAQDLSDYLGRQPR